MHHIEQLGFEVESTPPAFDGKGRMIDYVNAPPHYANLKPEPIDVIEAWALEFAEGTALAYIARARFKGDEMGDLRKAVWYLNRKIKQLESARAENHALRGDGSAASVVASPPATDKAFRELMDEARKMQA